MGSAKTTQAKALLDQEKLLPFLLDPASYPHRPRKVQLIQTHASFAFLAPPFVYKIKKPVNFGFLDFSTLAKRRHYCEREVALNRRLSPDMYFGIVPISRKNGRFTFDESGEAVEYAVKMRKLSKRNFLDKLLARDVVGHQEIDRIVAKLSDFYQAQHPTEEIENWGRIDQLKISTEENFTQTKEFITKTLSKPAFETIRSYTNEFFARNRELFDSRIRERWIRDCHGDLRLEHIHLTQRDLHIYDCIEFNDRFRYVDVANDIAFLAMDFDFEGRGDLARYFAKKTGESLSDVRMGKLIDFYKCYRAYVRGKVESFHSMAHAAPPKERQSSADRARRYFQLALQYAVTGSQPEVLVVTGRIASGKSSLARALAEELGRPIFSSDSLRKELAGVSPHVRGDEASRARLYSAPMTEKTYEALLNAARDSLRQGVSAIVDATFSRRAHRAKFKAGMDAERIPFRFLEVQADDKTVKARLHDRESDESEVSDARLEDFERLTRNYEPPTEMTQPALLTVRSRAPLQDTLKSALRALVETRMDS